MSTSIPPVNIQWISSYGQEFADNTGYYNAAQVQCIAAEEYEDTYVVTLYLTYGGVSVGQHIYSGYATLADAQTEVTELAAATGIVVS